MINSKEISINLVNGSINEYIIKDYIGITLGRIFIIELSKENKYCSFRIKFYKNNKDTYKYLRDTLNKLIISLFNNMCIFKINVLAEEDINLAAFTDIGFQLEGVLSNTCIKNNIYKDELIFGIDKDTFGKNIMKKIILHGDYINLKVLTPENSEEVLEYYIKNKHYLEPFEPTREENFYTIDVQRRTLIESYKQFLNGTSINFGIYNNDKFIGKIQLSNIVMGVFRSCFVGYSIDQDEQGKGYMTETLKLVVDYAFKELEINRIEASTLLNNDKSQNVLKRCGFKELGLNEGYLYINGKWRDHITFYILNKN
ncbi:GNAT family N-acetyltransferase [Clostridium rectalis]|uniref:GNAT family N-acetyltransferase n=1 Tax=Clostridium rectalis TaxID=2040295 RepID=UPI000F644AAA|nr:GNAT family protein [Clostridium rectalis]